MVLLTGVLPINILHMISEYSKPLTPSGLQNI